MRKATKLTRKQAKARHRDRFEQGIEEFKEFHWDNEPKEFYELDVKIGQLLVEIGPIMSLSYHANKGRESAVWEHTFGKPQPIICYDEYGNLVIIGGAYHIDESGIVD